MTFSPSNAFAPYIDGPGLKVNINGGYAVIAGVSTSVNASQVSVSANSTTNIYLDQTSGLLVATTGSFPVSGIYPIATAVSDTSSIRTLTDVRSDVVGSAIGYLTLGPVILPNAIPVSFSSSQTSITGGTDVVLYTVPSGRRCIFLSLAVHNGTGGSSSTFQVKVGIGGTNYILNGLSASLIAGSINNAVITNMYIAEAGEQLIINNTTTTTFNTLGYGIEFDNVSGLKTSKILSLQTGNNTVYTTPAGKRAFSVSLDLLTTYNKASTFYANTSGNTRTYSWNVVLSGGAVNDNNRVSTQAAQTTITNTVATAAVGQFVTNSGDFVNINTDANTATQWAWINILEF